MFAKNKDDYIFAFYNYMSDKILTISELICIFDEAYFIMKYCKDYPENVINEVTEIASREDDTSWVINEIYSRIEALYRLANNIKSSNKTITNIENIHSLYDNELQILFNNKWRKTFGDKESWLPYTSEYEIYLKDLNNNN